MTSEHYWRRKFLFSLQRRTLYPFARRSSERVVIIQDEIIVAETSFTVFHFLALSRFTIGVVWNTWNVRDQQEQRFSSVVGLSLFFIGGTNDDGKYYIYHGMVFDIFFDGIPAIYLNSGMRKMKSIGYVRQNQRRCDIFHRTSFRGLQFVKKGRWFGSGCRKIQSWYDHDQWPWDPSFWGSACSDCSCSAVLDDSINEPSWNLSNSQVIYILRLNDFLYLSCLSTRKKN